MNIIIPLSIASTINPRVTILPTMAPTTMARGTGFGHSIDFLSPSVDTHSKLEKSFLVEGFGSEIL